MRCFIKILKSRYFEYIWGDWPSWCPFFQFEILLLTNRWTCSLNLRCSSYPVEARRHLLLLNSTCWSSKTNAQTKQRRNEKFNQKHFLEIEYYWSRNVLNTAGLPAFVATCLWLWFSVQAEQYNAWLDWRRGLPLKLVHRYHVIVNYVRLVIVKHENWKVSSTNKLKF